MKLNILYQFNDAYAPYAGVSIFSLLENNKAAEEIDIYILEETLTEHNRKKLSELAHNYCRKIIFIDGKNIISFIQELGIPDYRGSYATNLKMFFPFYLKKNHMSEPEFLLYIDSDTLILGDLSAIFSKGTEGFPVVMALDSLAVKHKRYVGLSAEEPYFNGGVMLLNIPLWENCSCTEKIIEQARNGRAHYMSPDQDLINVALKGYIGILDARYNFQPIHFRYSSGLYRFYWKQKGYYPAERLEEARRNPVIIHFFRFLGEFPWNRDSLHPYTDLFLDYLFRSPWKEMERKPSSQQGLTFRIERLLYRMLPDVLFMPVFRVCYGLFLWKAEHASRQGKNDKKM